MFRTALIALALVLASFAFARAQSATGIGKATAGNLHDAPNLLPLIIPRSVICALPATKNTTPREQRIKLAPGQKPLTACPPGATTYIDFSSRFPAVSNMPPPVVRPTTGQPP